MKIKRHIPGSREQVEIELTADELYRAYLEQEYEFDLDGVNNHFDAFEDEDLVETYGKTREELSKLYEDIARELRRLMDKYDMQYDYALTEAIDMVLGR